MATSQEPVMIAGGGSSVGGLVVVGGVYKLCTEAGLSFGWSIGLAIVIGFIVPVITSWLARKHVMPVDKVNEIIEQALKIQPSQAKEAMKTLKVGKG